MRISFLLKREKSFFVLLVCITVLLTLGAFEPVQAGSHANWELIYDHDANGNPISGSLAALVSAIRSGADVQIVQHGPDADVLIKSQHIRIENNGSLVVASLNDDTYNPAKTTVCLRVMLFKTDGTREIIFQENSGCTNSTANIPMTWFVNR